MEWKKLRDQERQPWKEVEQKIHSGNMQRGAKKGKWNLKSPFAEGEWEAVHCIVPLCPWKCMCGRDNMSPFLTQEFTSSCLCCGVPISFPRLSPSQLDGIASPSLLLQWLVGRNTGLPWFLSRPIRSLICTLLDGWVIRDISEIQKP